MMSCRLSVIICTYNGSARLAGIFAALAAQEFPTASKWELLLIDNASTDKTEEVARGWIGRFRADLRVLSEPKQGKAHAMRTGVAAARGELFCVVDDDNLLDPDYLASGVEFLDANPEVALIGGRTFPQFPDGLTPPSDFDERYAALLACRDRGENLFWNAIPPGAGQMGRTNLMRGIYEQIGTRLEDRVGDGVGCCEDLEKGRILERLGWRTAHVPELRLHHVMTARRLTDEYIDDLACAAVETGPWLRLVGEKERCDLGWQRRQLVANLLKRTRYQLLSLLPCSLHPKLERARFWQRFYAARANGYRALIRDREEIKRMIRAIDEAPEEMRPPPRIPPSSECSPIGDAMHHQPKTH